MKYFILIFLSTTIFTVDADEIDFSKSISDEDRGIVFAPLKDASLGYVWYTKFLSQHTQPMPITWIQGIDMSQITINVLPLSWDNEKASFNEFVAENNVNDLRRILYDKEGEACELTEQAREVLSWELTNTWSRPSILLPSYPYPCIITIRYLDVNEEAIMELINNNELFEITAKIPFEEQVITTEAEPIIDYLLLNKTIVESPIEAGLYEGDYLPFVFDTSKYFLDNSETPKESWSEFADFILPESRDEAVTISNDSDIVVKTPAPIDMSVIGAFLR